MKGPFEKYSFEFDDYNILKLFKDRKKVEYTRMESQLKNISHKGLNYRLEILVEHNFIAVFPSTEYPHKNINFDKERAYMITPSGKKLLENYKNHQKSEKNDKWKN